MQSVRPFGAGRLALEATPLDDGLAKRCSVLILAYLATVYWLTHYGLPGSMSADMQVYVVRPLVWLALGGVCLLAWRLTTDRPVADRRFLGLALLAGAFSISALLCAGVLLGFGHSPYSRQAFHMAENVWYLATFIFGLEMARAYLLMAWRNFNGILSFGLVMLVIAAVAIAPAQYTRLDDQDYVLQTLGRTMAPGLSESVLATFLASIGGPLPAFIYHFTLEGFRWLSPILPKLEWEIAAFVGTLTPALAMLVVRDAYFQGIESASGEAEAQKVNSGFSPLLLFAGAALVGLIWLNTGMLGVRPMVVSGPSMKPSLEAGDVVIVNEIDPRSVKVGDIIKFKLGPRFVVHRVVQIAPTKSGPVFVTKGDNNNVNDPPITAAQIEGKVILDVPYVGRLTTAVRDAINGVVK